MLIKYIKIIILLVTLTASTTFAADCSDRKYASGEHKQLGDGGFLRACSKSNIIHICSEFTVPREDGQFNYSYGDLVVLGDFFSSPDKAFKNKINSNRLDDLYRCIDKQGHVQYTQKTHPEIKYPTCAWYVIAASNDYLKLASTNEEHFGWNNIIEYTVEHERALDLAIEAYTLQDLGLFKKALFYNGFADHYLTDSFAAGHIRVARKQILSWTNKNIFFPFKHYISDAFAKILHDHEGQDAHGNEVGLRVKNSRGDEWTTHSDGQMNTCRPNTDPSIRLPVESVEESVSEIFYAFVHGQKPNQVFKPLMYVPFPIVKTPLEHFNLNGNRAQNKRVIKTLEKSLPLPLQWLLFRSTLAKLINAIPDIQAEFFQENRAEVELKPILQLRVPSEYLDAYTN